MRLSSPYLLMAFASAANVLGLRPGPWGGLTVVGAALALISLRLVKTRAGAGVLGFLLGLAPSSVALSALSPIAPTVAAGLTLLVATSFVGVGVLAFNSPLAWWPRVLRVALAWTATEFVWSSSWLGPTQLPFLTLGTGFVDTALLPASSVVGPRGLTFVLWLLAGILAAPVMTEPLRGSRLRSAITAVLLMGVSFLGFVPVLHSDFVASRGASGGRSILPVRIVQHAPSPVEMAAARFDPTVADAHTGVLTFRSTGLEPDRLVVWPEASLFEPWLSTSPPPDWLPRGTPVLLGGAVLEGDSILNAALLWHDDTLTVVGEKRFRVPWVERALVRGQALPPFRWQGVQVSVLLCFEVLSSALSREAVQSGAEVLIVLANDAYAASTPIPLLHARMARLRAAELGVPVVFVQATGPSSVIGDGGAVLAETERDLVAALDVDLRLASKPVQTPYARTGDVTGPISLAGTILVALRSRFKRGPLREGVRPKVHRG